MGSWTPGSMGRPPGSGFPNLKGFIGFIIACVVFGLIIQACTGGVW